MKSFRIVFIIIAVLGLGFLVYFFAGNRPVTQTQSSAGENIQKPFNASNMQITSPAFKNNGTIPSNYTCDVRIPETPPLDFSDVPEGTKSLVLIMDDPDVPKQVSSVGVFDHWVLYNIPASIRSIREGETPGIEGINSSGELGYASPCPPPQYQPAEHRYVFTLYALDDTIDLGAGASKEDVLREIDGHVIEQATLIGRYRRISKASK